MKADLAVAPLKTKNNRTLLSERVVDEFKRRQIKLIVINNDSIPEWLKSKMDGVLTTRPENYLSQL